MSMADDLSESLDSLRYLVATPGTFDSLYPSTDDDMLLQVLCDAFAECQLEGMLLKNTVEDDGFISPDITSGQLAMVLVFAAVRFLRSVLLNTNTSVTYKAGSAEYSTTQSASILNAILADLKAQKDRLIALAEGGSGPDAGNVAFYMADQYLSRTVAEWRSHLTPPLLNAGWSPVDGYA